MRLPVSIISAVVPEDILMEILVSIFLMALCQPLSEISRIFLLYVMPAFSKHLFAVDVLCPFAAFRRRFSRFLGSSNFIFLSGFHHVKIAFYPLFFIAQNHLIQIRIKKREFLRGKIRKKRKIDTWVEKYPEHCSPSYGGEGIGAYSKNRYPFMREVCQKSCHNLLGETFLPNSIFGFLTNAKWPVIRNPTSKMGKTK